MNDTNLMVLLMKILADQKAVVAPATNQSMALWGMIVAALVPTLASVAVWFKARAAEANAKAAEILAKVAVDNTEQTKKETKLLGDHINSRMDELQKETRKASFAEGQTTERASAAALIPPLPVVLTTPTEASELMKMMETMRAEIAALKAPKA